MEEDKNMPGTSGAEAPKKKKTKNQGDVLEKLLRDHMRLKRFETSMSNELERVERMIVRVKDFLAKVREEKQKVLTEIKKQSVSIEGLSKEKPEEMD